MKVPVVSDEAQVPVIDLDKDIEELERVMCMVSDVPVAFQRLRLQPDDVVIARVPVDTPQHHLNYVAELLQNCLPFRTSAIVLTTETAISTLDFTRLGYVRIDEEA